MSLLSGVAIEKQVVAYNQTLDYTHHNASFYTDDIAEFRLTVAVSLGFLVGAIQVKNQKWFHNERNKS